MTTGEEDEWNAPKNLTTTMTADYASSNDGKEAKTPNNNNPHHRQLRWLIIVVVVGSDLLFGGGVVFESWRRWERQRGVSTSDATTTGFKGQGLRRKATGGR